MDPRLDFIPDEACLNGEPTVTLPSNLFLGTSTWAFSGWKGLLYKEKYKSEKDFNQRSLEEYARNRWFRTVCIDSFFYNPPKRETLERYASQVPDYFKWVSKVWERITIFKYPEHPRYGKYAGLLNPDFLNADLFLERVIEPYSLPEIIKHTGPFVFQFSQFSAAEIKDSLFYEKLEQFLSRLPREFRFAVEIRNPELITSAYFKILNTAGVSHCFNQWSSMLTLKEQMTAARDAGGISSTFFTARLLTPHRVSYANATKLFEPFNRLKRPALEMRRDVLQLAQRAINRGTDLFITGNNKVEGNSPLMIVALATLIGEALANEEKKRAANGA